MVKKKNFLVEKRNVLNELRSNNLTLQELRFFCIYLAKINARDLSTRIVRFSFSEFRRIMELGRVNLDYIKNITTLLLQKVIYIPIEVGGYTGFQLFKKCTVSKNGVGQWFVEIDAHDEALPLLFDFKEQYFTYRLWNALKLKSVNQLRMYEILKQYEKVGERVVELDELKLLLGLNTSDYPRFSNFKTRVLDSCQEALAENTDIVFTYEPAKRGARGKINTLKFTINKNTRYVDRLYLVDFIDEKASDESSDSSTAAKNIIENTMYEDEYFTREVYPLLAEVCGDEFNVAEMQLLHNMLIKIVPYTVEGGGDKRLLDMADYLKHKYDELNWRAGQTEIKSRFGYLKTIIEAEATAISAVG